MPRPVEGTPAACRLQAPGAAQPRATPGCASIDTDRAGCVEDATDESCLRVPLTALVGWLVYMEAIDLLTAAGAFLILLGNLLNMKKTN